MDRVGCRPACDFLISGVGTNLDVLRPRDLTETPDVNGLKKCLVGERRKYAAPNIRREINDTLDAVGVSKADSETRKCFNFIRAIHAVKMPWCSSVRKREWPTTSRVTATPVRFGA
jgi:hypothetical protein